MAKRGRGKAKKKFHQEVEREFQEHKLSFLVFSVLRFLVVVVLVRQIMLHSYQSAFFCILTLLLLYVPSWVQVKLQIELPQPMEITVLCFIFAAEILGEVNAFYIVIPAWDTVLHTINGFLAAAVGFSLVMLLNENKRVAFTLSPLFLAIVAFCFSMTVGVLWEFFEFATDQLLHSDAQKDTIIHAIYSVSLDGTYSNSVVAVEDIQDVVVNGQSLGLGGYLDIGLIDTMQDLIVNFIGAAVFSLIGYLFLRGNHSLKAVITSFVPRVKTTRRETQMVSGNQPKAREERKPDGQAERAESPENVGNKEQALGFISQYEQLIALYESTALEHQLRYKDQITTDEQTNRQWAECTALLHETALRMEMIAERIGSTDPVQPAPDHNR